MRKVKITVIRVMFYEDLAEEFIAEGKAAGACPFHKEGDVYIYEGGAAMPHGFCPWAWHDIYGDISQLAANAENDWYKPGKRVVCCTDGARPVIYALEAV